MNKKTIFLLIIFSTILTFLTPFLFEAKFTQPPSNNVVYHGTPFPFFQSPYDFPAHLNQYPITIPFQLKGATFSFVPFFLSFMSIFLFVLAIFYLIGRFFQNGGYVKKKSEK
ncbi:hypothetical protein [Bacillus sp. FJAT-47783]|uniref:hypothetical protein n=1 Tax=Bacillus sp. FJAT-47783 TaxID=2922712 RepID=UPI001FADDC54|nr:hypothetical protein [Bacillus sp. FJAT-47783]